MIQCGAITNTSDNLLINVYHPSSQVPACLVHTHTHPSSVSLDNTARPTASAGRNNIRLGSLKQTSMVLNGIYGVVMCLLLEVLSHLVSALRSYIFQ